MNAKISDAPPDATAEPLDRCFSVRQLARHLAVSPAKVLAWIRSGKLRAIDVSGSPRRPQYRIPPEALADFRAARAVTPPAPPRRRRERRPAGWVEYY